MMPNLYMTKSMLTWNNQHPTTLYQKTLLLMMMKSLAQ